MKIFVKHATFLFIEIIKYHKRELIFRITMNGVSGNILLLSRGYV